jgi:hypothetical protein
MVLLSAFLSACRNRRCPKGRHYALSFLVLGAVASGYHGADRQSWLRPVMRKLDYYSICYTSTVLRRAAHISLPNAAKAAAVFIAPFKPSIVTGLNLALVEVRGLRQEGFLCLESTAAAHAPQSVCLQQGLPTSSSGALMGCCRA